MRLPARVMSALVGSLCFQRFGVMFDGVVPKFNKINGFNIKYRSIVCLQLFGVYAGSFINTTINITQKSSLTRSFLHSSFMTKVIICYICQNMPAPPKDGFLVALM